MGEESHKEYRVAGNLYSKFKTTKPYLNRNLPPRKARRYIRAGLRVEERTVTKTDWEDVKK